MPATEESLMDDYAYEDGPHGAKLITWREVFATLIPRRLRARR